MQTDPSQGVADGQGAAVSAGVAEGAGRAADAPVSTEGRGAFVTLEGGEGAGKSTHARLLAAALRHAGYDVVQVREPGGTPIGEALRAILLAPESAALTSAAELFLYEAARAQIVAEVIAPALARGAAVVCDRFTDSTLAYQGAGRGLDPAFIAQANELACAGIAPDLTVVLRPAPSGAAAAEEGLKRACETGEADRLEQAGLAFHERVNHAFEELVETQDGRHVAVASDGPIPDTAQAVAAAVQRLFPQLSAEDVDAAIAAEGHLR
ncbi:dTMP kinase [Xiamenia xianingshaonis]|uniref:Thymidylate kinase n=1 Tax=Xiamenia xianingshaonis TaxID=2682776 RepID=A0A9E6MPZ0_9ACTN|nr:dTMP kinase [Xiamenia xianingshaonis]NHM13970.1 dTMP kinase [Xiamenia xianingshaonis]QTU83847.1 dTMP kinase [Xiamenia xianingshaonis]